MGNWGEKDLKEFAQAWFIEGWQAGEAITILDIGTYFERRWKKMKEAEKLWNIENMKE